MQTPLWMRLRPSLERETLSRFCRMEVSAIFTRSFPLRLVRKDRPRTASDLPAVLRLGYAEKWYVRHLQAGFCLSHARLACRNYRYSLYAGGWRHQPSLPGCDVD